MTTSQVSSETAESAGKTGQTAGMQCRLTITLPIALIALIACGPATITHAAEEEAAAPPPPPDICRSRDSSGNIVFSDQCGDRREEVELREATMFTPPDTRSKSARRAEVPHTPKFIPYGRLAITGPEAGENLRDNAGNVHISVRIEPGLQPGHRLQVLLDGKPVGPLSGGGIQLENVDRGEHELRAVIVGAGGQSLQESAPSSFMLHRVSKLLRKAGR